MKCKDLQTKLVYGDGKCLKIAKNEKYPNLPKDWKGLRKHTSKLRKNKLTENNSHFNRKGGHSYTNIIFEFLR